MPVINLLPKHISELIAAGEVVDRPASIVKELVENSLDAGADRITVEIKNGGITYLRVSDNGCGIEPEQVHRAFIRHATSKLATAADLDSIGTLGFRGEALPSIAAVSHVTLTTRTAESQLGCRCSVEGEESIVEEAGCAVGTTVEIRELFYNTPARMKFLKRDVTEGNAVATLLDRLALANPKVSFQLIREGQRKLHTPGGGSLKAAVRVVCGGETASQMIETSLKSEDIFVSGLISRSGQSKQSRSMQMFFINSRYIRSKTCESAVEEAYKNRLMGGRFPFCVLNVELDASTVDVNVHPAKLEVRFSDERKVYNAVYSACMTALSQSESKIESLPVVRQPQKVNAISLNNFDYSRQQTALPIRPTPNLTPSGSLTLRDSTHEFFPPPQQLHTPIRPSYRVDIECEPDVTYKVAAKDAVKYTGITPVETPVAPPIEPILPPDIPWQVIGEVFDTYILVSKGESLLLIDKHAAHERYLYNQIKGANDTSQNERQLLLTPQTISLTREEYFALTEHPEALSSLGIVAEDFGDGTVLVREVPLLLSELDLKQLLEEAAASVISFKHNLTPVALDKLLYSVCCRAAVMAGKSSALPELRLLAAMVIEGDVRFCPHGRPAVVTLSRRDLEKMFGRLV